MCSSSKCDVAGLINGPLGNIVEMGMRALVNGAPAGPRSSEALKNSKERENIRQFYDNIEAHLEGTLRILKPAMEINRILVGECKSAGNERPAPNSGTPIMYYTPQNSKKLPINRCPARCSGLKKFGKIRGNEKSLSSETSYSYNERSTKQINSQVEDSLSLVKCSNKFMKNVPKMCFTSMKNDASAEYSGTYVNQENICRAPKKSSKLKQVCSICGITLKDNFVLSVLPCDHLFCYTCLAKAKSSKCQKCDKSFDMRNITRITTTF